VPLQPFDLFGKRKPVTRDLFERIFDVWLVCLCRVLLRLDSATAIQFGPRMHLIVSPAQMRIWRSGVRISSGAPILTNNFSGIPETDPLMLLRHR